jgi:signal transduction histidine kinase
VGVLVAPSDKRIPLSRSIIGRVVRSGVPEVLPDAMRDPEVYRPSAGPAAYRSAIAIPLRVGADTIGGLVVVRGVDREPFTDAQRDTLQRFADQAAIAIAQARLIRQLEEANRLEREVLATLSHELRTPLTGILLWTEILRGESSLAALPVAREGLSIITESAGQLLSMVDDLLDLGRVESGRLRLECQPADIGAAVRRALAPHRQRAESRGLQLEEDIPTGLPPVVCDPARVQQMVGNLLANAVKFTDPPGRIMLRVRAEGDAAVAIEVEDSGCGIPPDVLPRIFDRFRQGDPGPARRHGGLGIGLALTRALAEAHGGRIGVRSAVGAGSTFTLTLPCRGPAGADEPAATVAGARPQRPATEPGSEQAATEPRSEHAGNEPDSARAGGPVVLVADDVAETRQALAMILSSRGYRVLEARDGEEVVRRAAERPDVILLDVAMPRVDGITALGRLRADPATAGIPVIAATARAMPDERARIEAAGFEASLTKPFRAAELLALIEQVLADVRR